MKSIRRVSCIAAFALAGPCLAFGQQPPPQAPPATVKQKAQAPAPKKPVVWTDDNISSVRSSSDLYQMEQGDKSDPQQVSARTAAPAAAGSQNGRPVPQVRTAQQADDLIAGDKQKIQSEQDYIQQTEKQLSTAPDSYKPRLQWRIQTHTNIINELQSEISAVQKEKDALAKQGQPSPASSPTAQPPSQ